MAFSFINRIFILTICFLKFLSRGKSDKRVNNPQKILIVQSAKLGDMVCTTPMFRAIKREYPGSRVYVVGSELNKELLANNPDVDEYIVYSGNPFSVVGKLKQEKIDFACVAGPDFMSLVIAYLSNIPSICAPYVLNGFSPYETKSYIILRNVAVLKPHAMGRYAPRERLRLLEPIGIFTDVTEKHLSFSDKAENKILNFFLEEGVDIKADFLVGISPSAGNKIKFWGGRKFAELADYICQKYNAKIIVVGIEEDRKEVEEMVTNLDKNTRIINAIGLLNIDELKALISKLNVFISVDTGPVYIAEAFNVPTIDIVGPVDEREQPPIGDFHRVVKIKNREKPELHVMNARVYNAKEAGRQIDEISVSMVINQFDDLFRYIKEET